jgi:hypothetical protein
MDADRLVRYLEEPEIQDRILNDYDGGFSMGLTTDPNDPGHYVIRVRIEGDDTSAIAKSISLNGERIRVLVETRFHAPRPLNS